MPVQIVTSIAEQVNIQADVTILIIRAIDKRGQWTIEVAFKDGIKATRSATADEVNAIESRLADLGWQVDASLFHRGFNAKPCPELIEGPPIEVEELIFASSVGMWPDDMGLAEPTL